MGKANSIRQLVCWLLLTTLIMRNHAIVIDVKTRGAKADGVTNDGPAFVKAWTEACGGGYPPNVVVFPPGNYLVGPPVDLTGPCKGPIEIRATGATIKAPPQLAAFKTDSWISIKNVDKLTMNGGIFNGQGQEAYTGQKCRDTQLTCNLPVNIRLGNVRNSLLRDVTSQNSKYFHMHLHGCDNTNLDRVTIAAPGNSPNTDGIHLGMLNGLNITNSNIQTGDDCFSIAYGCKNIRVEKVTCGPGHGISIGSLGKYPNEQPVQGVWVRNCTITGTTNGVRIKTWPSSPPGVATDIHFEDIIMNKVQNPILIDQEYCPSGACKKGPPSRVKISNVSFRRIRGTSMTKEAVKIVCSTGAPCDNVEVADINLINNGPGGPAVSVCTNSKPRFLPPLVPPACRAY